MDIKERWENPKRDTSSNLRGNVAWVKLKNLSVAKREETLDRSEQGDKANMVSLVPLIVKEG